MEVASPLPFPPQAGTKRPFAFGSPDPGASAVAAAAGTASSTMMEHDSAQTSEQLMADAFGQHHHQQPAKRRRRFESSSDENVVNGTASFPAFGGGIWGASSSSPVKAAVPPHGTFPFLARVRTGFFWSRDVFWSRLSLTPSFALFPPSSIIQAPRRSSGHA